MNASSFIVITLLATSGLSSLEAEDTHLLSVRIVDEDGNITPARAWVDADKKRLFHPSSPKTATPYERDRSFSCEGKFTMNVPIGKVVIHVEKGKEFFPVDQAVTIGEERLVETTITMKRWIDMPTRGWYSGDLHVHLGHDDPGILRQLSLADDVHLVPAFTYWLRGRGEKWNDDWPDKSYTTSIRIDDRHLITRNNIEIERINKASIPGGFLGATFLYNLNSPVSVKQHGEHFPIDATLCRIARRGSPNAVFDCDKPSWAGTAISAALGTLDTVQVCHNHYHRAATISGGWGMIGPLTPGESNAADDDSLFHRTNALYYRLLNCGFRLGVSGGSAIGVMPVATGQHRVYAMIEEPFTADKFWKATKAGQSFATSGPMIELTVNGKGIGSTLSRESKSSTPIVCEARVHSIDPLESLQIIYNGRVATTLDLVGKRKGNEVIREHLRCELMPKRSGWVAARAYFRAPDGRLRQGHTSPVYLAVDEKPAAFSVDANYMLRWVAVLEIIAKSNPERFPSPSIQADVLSVYEEARTKYQEVLSASQQFWGD